MQGKHRGGTAEVHLEVAVGDVAVVQVEHGVEQLEGEDAGVVLCATRGAPDQQTTEGRCAVWMWCTMCVVLASVLRVLAYIW